MEDINIDGKIDHTDLVFREWLRGMLKVGPVTLTFEKADGTLREMQASLESGVIVESVKKTDRTKKPNDDVCSVWDIEKQQWRSFRWDKLRTIRIVIGK